MDTTFGVIGTGPWGRNVISTVRDLGHGCAICNRSGNFNGLEHISDRFTDYRQLVDRSDIVFIAANPLSNIEIGNHAISRGKPTIIEKPAALSPDEIHRLAQVAHIKQTSLIVNYIHLFNSVLIERVMTQFLAGSKLYVTIENDGPIRDFSPLWDYGSHAVAVALKCFGTHPVRFNLEGSGNERRNIIDLDLEFPNGKAVLRFGNAAPRRKVTFRLKRTDKHEFRYVDSRKESPLTELIKTMSYNYERKRFWSNGELAFKVTSLLSQIEKASEGKVFKVSV